MSTAGPRADRHRRLLRASSGRALPCVALGALLLAAPAGAAEVTREGYREAVEPICKANTEANEQILKDVKAEVRANQLKPAAAQFAKAAKALKHTVAQLGAVPQPSADRARLAKWLGKVKAEAGLFERVGRNLGAGQKSAAEQFVVELTHNADLANDLVLAFEFEYCRFEPSRFT